MRRAQWICPLYPLVLLFWSDAGFSDGLSCSEKRYWRENRHALDRYEYNAAIFGGIEIGLRFGGSAGSKE
jgi:hypothetical protein